MKNKGERLECKTKGEDEEDCTIFVRAHTHGGMWRT